MRVTNKMELFTKRSFGNISRMNGDLNKEKAPKGDFPIHYLCWLSQPRHRPVTVRIMSLCMHMLAHTIPLAQLAASTVIFTAIKRTEPPEGDSPVFGTM